MNIKRLIERLEVTCSPGTPKQGAVGENGNGNKFEKFKDCALQKVPPKTMPGKGGKPPKSTP